MASQELGHQFKLMVVRADIFTESGFSPTESYEWLRAELLGYGKPTVLVVDGNDLVTLAHMIALHEKFSIEPVELAVVGSQTVTFRAETPLEFDGSIWTALAQRFGLQTTDSIMVFNWTGLRGSESNTLSHFAVHGWNKPSAFISALSQQLPKTPE